MFCICTLPLARPAQAKIQMLTISSWIVTILLKSLLKYLGLYLVMYHEHKIIRSRYFDPSFSFNMVFEPIEKSNHRWVYWICHFQQLNWPALLLEKCSFQKLQKLAHDWEM